MTDVTFCWYFWPSQAVIQAGRRGHDPALQPNQEGTLWKGSGTYDEKRDENGIDAAGRAASCLGAGATGGGAGGLVFGGLLSGGGQSGAELPAPGPGAGVRLPGRMERGGGGLRRQPGLSVVLGSRGLAGGILDGGGAGGEPFAGGPGHLSAAEPDAPGLRHGHRGPGWNGGEAGPTGWPRGFWCWPFLRSRCWG